MTTHATRTASLLSLNLQIGEYESAVASGIATAGAASDLIALDGRVYSALAEHHEHLRSGEAESEAQAFRDLITRRDIARKAAAAASRGTSLLHLNQLIDELEFLTGTFTEDATPTVLALIKQIRRAGREHYDFFQKGESESDIRAFDAMFDRFQ